MKTSGHNEVCAKKDLCKVKGKIIKKLEENCKRKGSWKNKNRKKKKGEISLPHKPIYGVYL